MKVQKIVSVLLKRSDCDREKQGGKQVVYRIVGGKKEYAHFGPDNNGEISPSKARDVLVKELKFTSNVAEDILSKA